MKLKIGDVATVQVGYSFRSRLEASGEGGVAVIQMKDLRADNIVDCRDLTFADITSVKNHHLAQRGDLIFRSRGLVMNSAILVDDPDRAIVAAPLLRIRVTSFDKVMPEYLNWYIAQRDAQSYLSSSARGTAQKMINKQVLEDMELLLPSMEQQALIVDLAGLAAREKVLLGRIAEKRNQYISTMLMHIAKGE
jgi:Type I restriction modification DNA specificity domain